MDITLGNLHALLQINFWALLLQYLCVQEHLHDTNADGPDIHYSQVLL